MNKEESEIIISLSSPPILQKGPVCGFVVLAYNGIYTLEEWIQKGKEEGLTISGELFNALDLSKFANKHGLLNRVERYDAFSMVNHLLNGRLIGIPYDSDKNHIPMNANGSFAHWGLIHGFSFDQNLAFSVLSENTRDSKQLIQNEKNLNFLIRQGKSKYSRWIPHEILKESNSNLLKVRDNLDPKLYMIPKELENTLANLILLL